MARRATNAPVLESSGYCAACENSHRHSSQAITAPASCAAMKPGTSPGAIPAKLLLSERATVIAGLAKLVDEVNQ